MCLDAINVADVNPCRSCDNTAINKGNECFSFVLVIGHGDYERKGSIEGGCYPHLTR